MRLSLVRHAETTEDARRRCYGRLDVGLSDLGRTQCESLAEWFGHEPVGAVVTSPAVRARETASAIAAPHGLTVEIADSLRELDFGELEGRRYDEIAESDPELYERWMSAPTTVRFPGGESYADLEARAGDAISTLARHPSARPVVVVTHGGVIRAVLRSVLGFPAEHLFRIAVDPASVTTLEWVEGEPLVRELNRTR